MRSSATTRPGLANEDRHHRFRHCRARRCHALRDNARITLYESGQRLGGHTNTVDVTLDGVTAGVDTGFLVFNERTYPKLVRLFDQLSIPVAKSDMSFGVSVARSGGGRLEWAGTDLNAVFAQRRNLLSPFPRHAA